MGMEKTVKTGFVLEFGREVRVRRERAYREVSNFFKRMPRVKKSDFEKAEKILRLVEENAKDGVLGIDYVRVDNEWRFELVEPDETRNTESKLIVNRDAKTTVKEYGVHDGFKTFEVRVENLKWAMKITRVYDSYFVTFYLGGE